MADQGLDYSWARPDPGAVYAAGYRFVCRYLSDTSDPSTLGKVATAAEVAALRGSGLAIALVWEYRAGDALNAALGPSQAAMAVSQARALGYPAGATVFFAVDTDTTAAAVAGYFRAVAPIVHQAGYRVGVYAGVKVVSGLFDLGLIDDAWQTYAWSGGAWDARAALRQVQNGATVAGASVDINQRVGSTHLWEVNTMGQLAHTFQLQTTGYYCGPAATRVALTARGITLSQDALARELGTTAAGTNSIADVVRVLNAHVGNVYGDTFIPGQTATQAEIDAMRAAIVRSIDAGYAVVVNVVGSAKDTDGRTYSYPGGHYVTVTGYSNGGDVLHVDDIAAREYAMTTRALAIWCALRGYAFAANVPTGSTIGEFEMFCRYGDQNDSVVVLQTMINLAGVDLAVDGKYGDATATALGKALGGWVGGDGSFRTYAWGEWMNLLSQVIKHQAPAPVVTPGEPAPIDVDAVASAVASAVAPIVGQIGDAVTSAVRAALTK